MSIEELHRKIYQKGILEQWAKITVTSLKAKLEKKHIGKTGALASSFNYSVSEKGIRLSFNYYGKFVDMGVGKGTKIGQAKMNRDILTKAKAATERRKRKPWLNKTLQNEIYQLTRILASQYGKGTAEYIKASLSIPILLET